MPYAGYLHLVGNGKLHSDESCALLSGPMHAGAAKPREHGGSREEAAAADSPGKDGCLKHALYSGGGSALQQYGTCQVMLLSSRVGICSVACAMYSVLEHICCTLQWSAEDNRQPRHIGLVTAPFPWQQPSSLYMRVSLVGACCMVVQCYLLSHNRYHNCSHLVSSMQFVD